MLEQRLIKVSFVPLKFRVYEKKRGHRRTGSQKLASLGEAAFFAVFLIFGLYAFTRLLTWLVIPEWRANRHFVATTCEVVGKPGVQGRYFRDAESFRPAVRIRYEVDGRTYETVTFGPVDMAYSDSDKVRDLMKPFVIGQRYPCWYDPLDPRRAVLLQGYSGWMYMFLLVPLPFIMIGGFGLVLALMRWSTSAERRAVLIHRAAQLDPFEASGDNGNSFPQVPAEANLTNSPGTTLAYRLPVTAAPGWMLFATLMACLAWNAIVVVFVVMAIRRHSSGNPDWLLTVFVVPFALAGMGLVVYFVRKLLATTGVGATRMEISKHPLLPGDACEIYMSQAGRLMMNSLEVLVACEEKATYRQGTDTRTEFRRVYEDKLFAADRFEIRQGLPFEQRITLRIPEAAMHSFKSDHNEINWKLVVRGDVDGWPCYERVFPVVVYPAHNGNAPA